MPLSFKELMSDKYGSIFISVILGLGLSAIFRKACKDGKCIVLRGPKPEELTNNTYSWYNNCFQYQIVPTKCGDKDKLIKETN